LTGAGSPAPTADRRRSGSERGPAASDPDALGASHSAGRNAAFALATQLSSAAFTAALTLYLARTLGPAEFGVFSLALGIGTILLLPADFGVSSSAARFLAERRTSRSHAANVLATATRIKVLVTGAVCGTLFALSGPIAAAYDQGGLEWALRGIAIAVFGQSLMMLYSGATTGLARSSLNFRIVLSESAVELGASVALVALGAGAAGAAFGRAIGYGVGALIGGAVMFRLVGREAATGQRMPARRLASYAGALLIVEGAFALFTQIDVLLIGGFIGAAAAGMFQAPLRIVTFLHYPGMALATGAAPRLAAEQPSGREVEPFRQALRHLVLLQAFLAAIVLVWAAPIVELALGPKFSDSAGVLRALAPYVFLSGLAPLVSMGVNYLGEARLRVPIAVGAVLVNLVIDVVLIPRIGIIAGAIGTNVAYALYVPAHFWICRRMVDLPLRPLGLSILRALAAAAVASGVLTLFGISEVSVPLMLVAGVCAAFAYTAVLVALRELALGDLRQLPKRLWALRGRPA
jgi:O-antigen/teichoic acid export membrane protein